MGRFSESDFWEWEDVCNGQDRCLCSSCFNAKSSAKHFLENLKECVENDCLLSLGCLKNGCGKWAMKLLKTGYGKDACFPECYEIRLRNILRKPRKFLKKRK